MAKVKEPTVREVMIHNVAQALMEKFDLGEIAMSKEGLVLQSDEETFVVKVIQKKNPIFQEDIKGMIELAGEEAEVKEEDVSEADEWADEE
jgi:hypothetical protein